MMDLREFLDNLEKAGELHTVAAQVDPKHELGAICKIFNERPNSPALLFENVKGSTISVVGQLLASDRRVALALGLSQSELLRRLGLEDAMDYRRISEFERGTTEPHLSVLLQYARAAGVHMEDIVDDELDLPERLPTNVRYRGIAPSSKSRKKR